MGLARAIILAGKVAGIRSAGCGPRPGSRSPQTLSERALCSQWKGLTGLRGPSQSGTVASPTAVSGLWHRRLGQLGLGPVMYSTDKGAEPGCWSNGDGCRLEPQHATRKRDRLEKWPKGPKVSRAWGRHRSGGGAAEDCGSIEAWTDSGPPGGPHSKAWCGAAGHWCGHATLKTGGADGTARGLPKVKSWVVVLIFEGSLPDGSWAVTERDERNELRTYYQTVYVRDTTLQEQINAYLGVCDWAPLEPVHSEALKSSCSAEEI
ncbi:hypothetical protein NDU88_000672 [Pleurodeles waltl]|uniref:Uncharacterized protein n=1 Tax=Pleurodeles waltl TaxID=8319 RepID=A0AAV7VUT5_PLEWA|nr:hypothetical protein NDU88_000672 [Pleurodeles waltl]